MLSAAWQMAEADKQGDHAWRDFLKLKARALKRGLLWLDMQAE